jgi:cytochrome c-type biogenesis protein CcmH/NrfG
VNRHARPTARTRVTRSTKRLYARLGLTPEAGEAEVERAREELVSFLEGAPEGLRRWARSEIASVNEAHAGLSGAARGAAARRGTRLRRAGVAVATLAVAAGVVIGVYNAGGGEDEPASQAAGASEQQGLSPGDEARVARLTSKLDANPKDAATLVALGNVYFNGGDYDSAGGWMEKAIAVEPRNVKARLALGASQFNLGDVAEARGQWQRVVALDPKNVEAYYDLGFLYLSKNPPEMARAKRMWRRVIELAPPGSSVAKTVATHLKGLEKAESGSAAATPPASER